MNAPSKSISPIASWITEVDRLCAEGRYADALKLVLPRLQAGQVEVDTLDRAATCFVELGDGQAAVGLMEALTQHWPNLAPGWSKLAMMREVSGDREGAIRDYARALKQDPNLPSALYALNKLAPYARQSARTGRVRKLVKSAQLGAMDRAMLFNTLGTIERRSNRPDRAFAMYAKSNAALGGSYNEAAMDQLVDAQQKVFVRRDTPVPKDGMPRIIFVCGMPRSGTTLVETILARHGEVTSIGESKALKNVLKSMREHVAATGRGRGYWDWFTALEAGEIAQFRQRYFAQALAGQAGITPVIVDKMPLNCLDIGAAHVLMPEARFVFLSRHPLDTALSNFSTCFSQGCVFSRQLPWIGHLTQAVYRSLRDYRDKLGDMLHVQSYEALVRCPEPEIRSLLGALDLSWDKACLAPQDDGGVVRTASVLQVRERINTSALGNAAAFEAQLAPVVTALGGSAWITEWADWDRSAWTRAAQARADVSTS